MIDEFAHEDVLGGWGLFLRRLLMVNRFLLAKASALESGNLFIADVIDVAKDVSKVVLVSLD